MGDSDGLSLGQKLFISCKIGDFPNVMTILDEIDQLVDEEREIALEYTDKKGNTHLHAIIQAPDSVDDFYEEPTGEKKLCLFRLLDLDLQPKDTNNARETVFDLCPPEFQQTLEEYAERKRRSTFRGGSLVAEGATIKSMKAAANAVLAVGRFKGLQKNAAARNATASGSGEESTASGEQDHAVMEV